MATKNLHPNQNRPIQKIRFKFTLFFYVYQMEQSIYYFLFLFLIYLFVNSEVAVTRIFTDFSEATTDGHTTNTYGTILQALLLVFLYFLVVQIGNYMWEQPESGEQTIKSWFNALKKKKINSIFSD
jgi:hypothetical protein